MKSFQIYAAPVFWLGAFLLALLPLAAYEAHFFMLSFALLAGGLCFLILKYPFEDKIPALPLMVLIPLFGFWILAFASVIFSEVPYTSYIYFCFLSVLPLSFFWALAAKDKVAFFKIAGGGLAVIFAALSLWSLAQYFFLPSFLVHRHVHWPFADSNSLGALLSLGFFCAFGLMLGGAGRVQSNAGLVLSLLIFAALLVTGSRGALLCLIFALAFFIFMARSHMRRHRRCCVALAAGCVVIFSILSILAPAAARSPALTVSATLSGKIPVLWARPEIWRSASEIIKDHFWTGTGIGTFYLYYPQYRGGDFMTAGRMAHSDPLQFWAEMGVFAPLMFYIFLAIAGFLTFKALKKTSPDDVRRVYILAPFCALAAMVLHAHATFHFYVLALLVPGGFLLALLFYNVRTVLRDDFTRGTVFYLPARPVLKGAFLIALAGLLYPFLMLQGSEIVLARAQEKMEAGGLQQFARDVNNAGRMAQQKNANALVLAAGVPVSLLQNNDQLSQRDRGELFLQGYRLLSGAKALNPRLAAVPYYEAQIFLAKGEDSEKAENLLQEALTLNPLYFPARMMLADVVEAEGDKSKAYAILKEGLRWCEAQDVSPAYYQVLAMKALEHGDTGTQMLAMKKMAAVYKALGKRQQDEP